MNDQYRKQLQLLQKTPMWEAFEIFAKEFVLKNFAQVSIKRDTEFNTIWEAAQTEGGKIYIQKFIRDLEAEARKVEII